MPIATITINGVLLSYEISGQGNAVVFVHGYVGSNRDWVNQVPALASRYKVIAPDLRGHGRSAAPSKDSPSC